MLQWREMLCPAAAVFLLQKKILTGEARLVRMVAHPNIVRCMQVLETRRQQVHGTCPSQHRARQSNVRRRAATMIDVQQPWVRGASLQQPIGWGCSPSYCSLSAAEKGEPQEVSCACSLPHACCVIGLHMPSCMRVPAGAGAGVPLRGGDAAAAAAHEAIQRGKRLPDVQAGAPAAAAGSLHVAHKVSVATSRRCTCSPLWQPPQHI